MQNVEIQGVVKSAFTWRQTANWDNRRWLNDVSELYSARQNKRIVTIQANDGRIFKTFTTAEWAWNVNEGDSIKATAVIKEVGEYKGEVQTIVTRLKMAA